MCFATSAFFCFSVFRIGPRRTGAAIGCVSNLFFSRKENVMKKLFMAAVVLVGGFIQANAADKDLPLPTDQKFVVNAVGCTICETKLADIAIQRATNPEVKQLAQKLKVEHGQCLKQLMTLAATH